MIEYFIIALLGLCGFFLAFYIWTHKRKSKRLVCPMKGDCQSVIHSSYSKFFGIPVEVLGILYYVLIFVSYILLAVFGSISEELNYLLLVVTGSAFLFSGYLIFIQIFSLRQICTWCLTSATLSTAIFILSYWFSLDAVMDVLLEYRSVFVILHVFAMSLGLGAATLADYFFLRFIRDYRISQSEAGVLEGISQFIWFSIALVLLTGFSLFLPASAEYLQASKFVAKMIIFGILLVNGAFLNLVIAPRLMTMTFDKRNEHHHKPGELRRHRRLAFALGPISIISWYSAFLLGSLRGLPYTS